MAFSRLVIAPNWIGDCVMAIPFLRAIRRAHPADRLVVLARPGPGAIFRAEATADEVLPRSGLLQDAWRVRRGGFDEAWLLPNSFRSALITWLGGVPERIGYATDRRESLLTRAPPPPPATRHQLRDYDRLLESREISPDLAPPRLALPAAAMRRARGALSLCAAGADPTRPLVLLCPGAAFSWTKRWPEQNYGRLIDLLAERGFRTAVLIGPGEEEIARGVAATARTPVASLGADLDPVELAALLSLARVAVANDSGPMHLAAAVGTSVVAFFGPTDPGRTSPAGSPSRILDRYIFCSPCFLKQCPYGHECLREITAQDALRAVEELIRSSGR